jgi:hypothetical protein
MGSFCGTLPNQVKRSPHTRLAHSLLVEKDTYLLLPEILKRGCWIVHCIYYRLSAATIGLGNVFYHFQPGIQKCCNNLHNIITSSF